MNNYQTLWWQQAQPDHEVFVLLRKQGTAQCQVLHYLQMVTEKLAKAYFWRAGASSPKTHAGFVQFLRFLGATRIQDRDRIAEIFLFKRFVDFQNWIRTVLPLAYDLQQIAPALANDGPNPEYPWPHANPQIAPVNHHFAVWTALTSSRGRDFMRVLHIAIARFSEYADT